jgi:hypothetical protein
VITGTELEDSTSQPLLDTELPLIDAMPIDLPDVSAGEIDGEGPLALDSRVWDEQALNKQLVDDDLVESPADATWTLAADYVYYDGCCPKSYKYYYHVMLA